MILSRYCRISCDSTQKGTDHCRPGTDSTLRLATITANHPTAMALLPNQAPLFLCRNALFSFYLRSLSVVSESLGQDVSCNRRGTRISYGTVFISFVTFSTRICTRFQVLES
jgi:hypothetical protein